MPFKLGLNKKISFCILMLTKMRSYTSDHVRSQYLSSTYKLVSLLAKPLSYWPLDSYKNYFMFFLWPFCFPSLLCPLNHRIVTNQYWIPSKYHHLPQGRLYHLFNLARSWGDCIIVVALNCWATTTYTRILWCYLFDSGCFVLQKFEL